MHSHSQRQAFCTQFDLCLFVCCKQGAVLVVQHAHPAALKVVEQLDKMISLWSKSIGALELARLQPNPHKGPLDL